MIQIFTPKHYPSQEWNKYVQKGYKISKFVALPQKTTAQMDACALLQEARNMLFCLYDSLEKDECCILAKVINPDKNAIIIRVDRDYYEACVITPDGKATVQHWQFAENMKGFRQDELWCNMAEWLDEYTTG